MRPALPAFAEGAVRGGGRTGPCGLHDPAHRALRRAWTGALVVLLGLAWVAQSRAVTAAADSAAPPASPAIASVPDSARDSAAATTAAAAIAAPAPVVAAAPRESGLPALLVPAFPALPLAPPLVVTGMFGERRPRHFHGGLDLSTGGVIGKEVHAPSDGWIERVRTQGVGYGRSIYLHTRNGFLVVFGHLDAFAEPLASFVAAAQDSSGQYDQDLWPARDRFRVAAGQILAWSGKSGTGQPHLHIEVRRGDTGLNPLRAGIPVADDLAPELRTVTLEPIEPGARVMGSAAPVTRLLGLAREETLVVVGRLRVLARAVDPGERGASLAPWRLRATWGDAFVEWRADSASWVTDMVDVDYVYDAGRAITGPPVLQLWAPPRWRPRLLRTNVPDSLAAGVIEVRPGDPARPLTIEVEDAAGHRRARAVWLRGPRAGEREPVEPPLARAAAIRARQRAARSGTGTFRYDALPGENLRVEYAHAPADLRAAEVLGVPATRGTRAEKRGSGAVWTAIVPGARLGATVRPVISGVRHDGTAWADSARPFAVARSREPRAFGGPLPFQWKSEPRDAFEPSVILYDAVGLPAPGTLELVPLTDEYAIEPADLPLREGVGVRIAARAPLDARAGLYVRDEEGGWSYVGGREAKDPTVVAGETRVLGAFAVLADTVAPRVRPLRPLRHAPRVPYSQWALRARVTEFGSGLDTRGTFFTVDGRRVPTESDAVRDLLVWRPLAPPARGTHRYELEARDRAGNVRRTSGTFVLD